MVESDSKITHTVKSNTPYRYAIYVSGNLTVSGDGELEVYLRGDCDFDSLNSYAIRATKTDGADKVAVLDGRSEQEKQIDTLKDDFDKQLNKTNYELALAKLNFANTTEAMKQQTEKVKTVAIVAVVIGSVSLVANAGLGIYLVSKRKANNEEFDEDGE